MIDLKEIIKSDDYDKIKTFYDFIIEENKKFNITAITDQNEFLIKNVADCIEYQNVYFSGAKIVEIGSGGGFPSVPLKIKREDLKFTLIESNAKKVNFLKTVAQKLGFIDFECVSGRAEDLSKNQKYRESFDYAIARAVAPLNILCELLIPFLKVGGYMIAYKGANFKEELEAAKNAIESLGGIFCQVKEYELSNDLGSRALVIIKKEKQTENIYPRSFAKIKKQPL